MRKPIATLLALSVLCSLASAQANQMDAVKKKMEEISRLMRKSEQLLLQVSNSDRLVKQQEEIAQKLKELEQGQPPNASSTATSKVQKQKSELEKKQHDVNQQLEELLKSQEKSGALLVKSIQELLQSLPRAQGQGQGGGDQKSGEKKPEDQEKHLREQEKERKQRSEQEAKARENEPPTKGRADRAKRKEEEIGAQQRRQIEAWIARLPPEEQERLERGDFSDVPLRYRELIKLYTIARGKREASGADGGK